MYCSPNVIGVIKSRIRRAGYVAGMGDRRSAYSFDGRPEGKRPLGMRKRRWKGNIKMDVQEVGWGGGLAGVIWLRIGSGGGSL